MTVPVLPQELWENVLAWAGPLALLPPSDRRRAAAMRIQRAARVTCVVFARLEVGRAVRLRFRSDGRWRDGAVVLHMGHLRAVELDRRAHFVFLPHPDVIARV